MYIYIYICLFETNLRELSYGITIRMSYAMAEKQCLVPTSLLDRQHM